MHPGSGVIIELSSIAKGYFILDQCLKAAKVHIIEASSVSPGKFLILLKGDVNAVGKAYDSALMSGNKEIIDSALIPTLNKGILDALYGLSKVEANKAGIVVLETTTLTSMLLGLHNIAAVKKDIQFIEVKPGRGLGGKSIGFITGNITDLYESLEIFLRVTKQNGSFIEGQVISAPHPDFLSHFNISGAN